MKDQRICIIGSGLAGLTTAVALSKLNLNCNNYELMPAMQPDY